ncbi:hypothetical protein GUJ93_ZPchr0014g47485 [Zizania palustris]|uniref:Uncharacterized protein n=1 Tax=Zizania palustris TaxID=103762 RepID=A0A8J5TFS8_ZIZPA|nr:hypothetical protein GUJ93_ZPchr0014g47485 [Zizania palustris]
MIQLDVLKIRQIIVKIISKTPTQRYKLTRLIQLDLLFSSPMSTVTASTTVVDSGELILRSASAIVSTTERCQHLLRIDGYSHIKASVTAGNSIRSRPFRVGGHDWHILYYPNGNSPVASDFVSVKLELGSASNIPTNLVWDPWYGHVQVQTVRAQFTFSLLDQAGEPVPPYSYRYEVCTFSNGGTEGPVRFIQKAVLERLEHLKNDRFTIRCDVTVIRKPEAKDHVDDGSPPTAPPPSDLARHLAGLLDTGESADVAFEVDGETFMAHRLVLAARSPVLRAELRESAGDVVVVRVDDMEAQDFEALLRYMYTDSLPETRGGDAAAAMLPDLVAAANRYKMERLRQVCEDKLCEYVNGTTFAAMLTFAGEHHCHVLKDKCLRFIDDPANLRSVVETTEGLEHLIKTYPSILKDLIAKLAMNVKM